VKHISLSDVSAFVTLLLFECKIICLTHKNTRIVNTKYTQLQVVWCRRPTIWAKEVDSLLWGCDSNHILCRNERVWSGSSRRWDNGEYRLESPCYHHCFLYLIRSSRIL